MPNQAPRPRDAFWAASKRLIRAFLLPLSLFQRSDRLHNLSELSNGAKGPMQCWPC